MHKKKEPKIARSVPDERKSELKGELKENIKARFSEELGRLNGLYEKLVVKNE